MIDGARQEVFGPVPDGARQEVFDAVIVVTPALTEWRDEEPIAAGGAR